MMSSVVSHCVNWQIVGNLRSKRTVLLDYLVNIFFWFWNYCKMFKRIKRSWQAHFLHLPVGSQNFKKNPCDTWFKLSVQTNKSKNSSAFLVCRNLYFFVALFPWQALVFIVGLFVWISLKFTNKHNVSPIGYAYFNKSKINKIILFVRVCW